MKDDIRERVVELLAAIPLALILSILMRVVAHECQIETPGDLFLDWYVPGSGRVFLGGPALRYELLVDLLFCLLILVGCYRVLQKCFYDS